MKPERPLITEDQTLKNHPLLIKLAELAAQLTGISMVAILSDKAGWKQVRIGAGNRSPSFCRLIQSTFEGAKRCKMCHILMPSMTHHEDAAEHRCHVGLTTLATPLAQLSEHCSALISTCMLTPETRGKTWQKVRAYGNQLGLDMKELRAAFTALPTISRDQLKLARSVLTMAAATIDEIKARCAAEEKLSKQNMTDDPAHQIRTALQQEQKHSSSSTERITETLTGKGGNDSALIRAVVSLITRQPALPYSAATIAAAARITPNHFSSLFHHKTGQHFSAYLAQQRIETSKKILRDLSLNIGEVANRVGYDDANYFARRFKQTTGLTPRAWRNIPVSSGLSTKQGKPVHLSLAVRPSLGRAAPHGGVTRHEVGDGG